MAPRRNGPQRFYRVRGGRRRKRRLSGWILAGLTVGVVLWVVVFGETGWRRVHAEKETVRQLREQVGELRASTETIRHRVGEIRQPASPLLEKVAREQYLMKREGEEVYHVLEAEPEDGTPPDDALR